MASSGSVFSETLQSITNTKLEELAQQRVAFEGQYSDLLEAAQGKQDPLDRLAVLVDGAKACLGVKTATRKTKDGKLGRVISGGTSNTRLETDLRTSTDFSNKLDMIRLSPRRCSRIGRNRFSSISLSSPQSTSTPTCTAS